MSPATELRLFLLAAAALVLHLLDDLVLQPPPGTSAGDHATAILVTVGAAVAGAALFGLLPAGARGALALVFGALTLVGGALHVGHLFVDSPSGSDFTGLLLVPAGLVFVGVGAHALRRGPKPASARRRWLKRAGELVVAILVAFYVVLPVGVAMYVTHKPKVPVAADDLRIPHENLTLTAADGVRLGAWYVPSGNGAAVLLLHGSGGSRNGLRLHAELLAEHGYGLLMYDARGRGESEGAPNGYGWSAQPDVDAGLAFLEARPDVEEGRIGVLGLSMGGEVALQAAARTSVIAAVVADGAGIRSFADARAIMDGAEAWVSLPQLWAQFAATRVLSGDASPPPLDGLVAEIAPRPLLLVAAGEGVGGEQEMNRLLAREAGPSAELWELPGIAHTKGLAERPGEYEERVVGFLDDALLGR
ncbi:MAG TPA: alpha/beta fold hydrolase [Gaiellaceae bacterium]|nr:alpha/beta fold hydrolase [Gaiellaceae bacterium]